jgi:hypothetical protein
MIEDAELTVEPLSRMVICSKLWRMISEIMGKERNVTQVVT